MDLLELSKEIQKSHKDITFSICDNNILFKAVKSKIFGLIVGIYNSDNITNALILKDYKHIDVDDLAMHINFYIKECCEILDTKYDWKNIKLLSYDYNLET